jgi:methylenetetrahydrofolate reductase (NADPH)
VPSHPRPVPVTSAFAPRLRAGALLTAELTPPRTTDLTKLLASARAWAGVVDAAHVNDCLLSSARMSNLAVAALMAGTGLEPILQMTLRHRNRIAMQADLLGAHALGVTGILVLSGYDVRIGSDPKAKDARDLRSAEAIGLTRRLAEHGRLFNGDQLREPPGFVVGAVDFVGPEPAARQIQRVEAKIDAGAQWLQVQGSFDPEVALAWFDAMHAAGIHERVRIVAGLIPLQSRARAAFLDGVPGITIPASAWARMQADDEEAEGFALAVEIGRALMAHPASSGVHVRPFGWEGVVPALAGELRAGAQPTGSAAGIAG